MSNLHLHLHHLPARDPQAKVHLHQLLSREPKDNLHQHQVPPRECKVQHMGHKYQMHMKK